MILNMCCALPRVESLNDFKFTTDICYRIGCSWADRKLANLKNVVDSVDLCHLSNKKDRIADIVSELYETGDDTRIKPKL